ncbi:undecaprenol kinase [Bacillus capparidis]|nr:undecaprenol kinase [Bacillus capparidis]
MNSFKYAFEGIRQTLLSERNFQIHTVAACVVIIFAAVYQISFHEWLIVLILIGGMLALELMNTAVEHIVDMVSPKHHPLAKAAKDASAAAVCVFAIISCMIGLLIFIPKIFL